ncbi:MAG TPA: acyloxyacyl hydrolase [Opitutaceae bacterium]
MRPGCAVALVLLRPALLALALVLIPTGDAVADAETISAVGVAGVFDSSRSTQTRLEHHFQDELLPGIRPFVAFGVAGDSAYHFGAGLGWRREMGTDWRILIGSGPAIYRRHRGFDLGNEVEFFSFLEVDRQIARGHWLGLRVAHASNASIGSRNPGREMLGIAYTRAWRETR